MLILPHILDVSIQFKPVHDFLPTKSIGKAPFIGINKWIDDLEAVDGNIYGCMDPEANNYNPDANIDDDSCTYNQGETMTEEEMINQEARLDTPSGKGGF